MRLTHYLPPGPSISTPPTERVRDVIAARHSDEDTLLPRMGFALIICIFVLLPLALPAFGHNTPTIKRNEATHNLSADWREFIQINYAHDDCHWHMYINEDDTDGGIGGWDKCLVDGYDEATGSYDDSGCSDSNPNPNPNPNSNPNSNSNPNPPLTGTTSTPGGTPLTPLPDDVTVSFTRTRYEASEDDEAVEFIVRLNKVASQEVVVDYASVSGTAMGGQDYEGTVGTLSFSAGARGRIISVPIIDDKLVEEEETFTVRLRNSNAMIDVDEATGAITDNDLQEVSVTTDQTTVEEGETVIFTVTRTGSDLTDPLRVPVSITEHGDFLADGTPSTTRAIFAANVTTTTIELETVDDEVAEAIGAVTATITDGDTYRVSDAASTTVAITDNDGVEPKVEVRRSDVTVSFAATRYEVSEDGRVLDFTVRLSAVSLEAVTVDYATASGTATAGQDYRATTGTLIFPILTTEQRIRVPIIDDNLVEEEETFTVRLRNSSAQIGEGKATGAITDNDLRATVSIAANIAAVVEGGTAAFTLTREGELTAPLTVPVNVTQQGAFLTDGVPTEATFATNAATTTLLVATEDDGRVEANGSVTATITSGAYQLGAAASATVAVIDNDVRGVTIIPTALTVTEGSSASYVVALDTEPTADVTVAVLAPTNAEISVAPTTLTFTPANWRTAKQLVTVTAAHDDDTVPDDPVTILHAVSGGDYGAVTAPSVTVTILEDDPALQIADATTLEDSGEMAFAVRLNVPQIQPVTVDYITADVTATAGMDYEATTGTLTFRLLETRQTIRVPIIDDDIDEAAETFTVALRNANVAITDGEATGVIADDDLPVVNLATDLVEVVEGETVAFTLTREGDLTVPLRVPVGVTERGAFLADGVPTEATFAANAATTTLLVATDDDERDEADGAVTATITSGPIHRVGVAASATVSVTDNDAPEVPDVPAVPPGVTVTPTALRVLEGDSASYTVMLDAEPTTDVTVAVQVPEDVEIAVDKTELTFATEDWNQTQTVTVTAAQDDDAVADDIGVLTHEVRGGNYDTVTAASVTVTILEDDTPALSVVNAVASEGDGEMIFTVRLNLASSQTVTTAYMTSSGTATAGRDYETTFGTLTFAALETEQTIRVPIIDDDLDETAEVFTVMLINASNATIEEGKATGVITDNDLPVVSVAADPAAVAEGETATFTLTRVGDLTVPLTVPIDITERGAFLADGTPTAATFAVGASHATLLVATVDDDVDEVNGLVTATIADGATHRAGDAARAIVPILDNDLRGVTATPTALTIPEGGSASYTVVLDTEPTAAVAVAVQVPEGAEIAVDKTELTFTTEDWNQAQTITVTATQDADAVADEPVILTHAVSGGDYDAVTAPSVAVTIIEDDIPTLWIADAEASEGDGEIAFQVRLSVASSQTVAVEYATADGTATAGTDYEATTGTLTFAALVTEQTIRVPIIDDDLDETAEAFTVMLINASNATIRNGAADGVIVDNDLPVVSVTADPAAVAEGETVTFTLTRIGDLTVPLTVPIDITERGAFLADGTPTAATFAVGASHATLLVATVDDDVDEVNGLVTATIADGATHRAGDAARAIVPILDNDLRGVTATPTALTIPEGGSASYTVVLDTEPTAAVAVAVQVPEGAEIAVDKTELTFTTEDWNQAQTITVTAAQDADAVADEPVILTHAVSGGDYDAVTAESVTVTITEDDTPELSITDGAATEGDQVLEFTVALSVASSQTVTVEYATTDSTATAGTDYEATTGTLTFLALVTEQTIRVPIIDDDLDETAEAFTVMLINASNATIRNGAADGVIVDNDLPVVSVTADPAAVAEGETVTFTLTRIGDLTVPLTVPIDITERGAFLADEVPIEAMFAADAETTTLEVTTVDDEVDDADGAVMATVADGATHRAGDAASATVSVSDNDVRDVTISSTSLTVDEGGSASYTVVLTSEPTADVTVAVQVPDNTDITVSPAALTFTAANWNQAQTIAVTAAHDDDAVADEPVVLTHTVSGGDYEGIAAASVEATITEDDTRGVTVSETALTIIEGDEASYTVGLDTEPAADVTITIQVPDNTDIIAAPAALTFTADNWNTPQTIAVIAAHDDDAVADEPVVLTHAVSGGDYENISAASVEATITEDDSPALIIADAEAAEGDGEITFTATLNIASSKTVTVDWATADETATQGADYAETTGTLTFDALETEQTITVPLLDDALDETDETFAIALSNPSNATLDDAEATGTITDNDDTPALTIADAEAAEGDGEITFTATLGAVSGLAVTVDWTTADGTATADVDYVAAEGRLTFAPGQTEAILGVVMFNDALDEGEETFTVALNNPSNATIANGTATGTITDDDPSVEKAWLARFGRMTASQVMDAVSDRLTGRPGRGAHLTVGGQRVTLATVAGRGEANAVGQTVPAKNASFADVLSQRPFYSLTRSSFADIILRSSFQVSSAKSSEEQGARWTAWGRGATTRFRSEEVDLSLTGGAMTSLLGGDWQRGRMLAGLAVAHSSGTGEYDVHTADEPFRKGELGTYLTSVHPYLRVAVTERLSAWGLFGYGRGQMERMGDRPDTDVGMQMGGLGARGALLSPTESSDFDVALKSDAFLVQMDTDAAVRPTLETMTSRLRLLLEGSRIVKLSTGLMSPSLEVGMRHDGGDAETGLGLEVGGGLGYTNPERGVALKAEARRLLVHQDNGYEEWGVGGSVNLDPGALGRGPSLRMQSSWGTSGSGMDRLWSQRSAADLARSTRADRGGLFDAELGYGLDALGGLLTPYARVASSGQDTRTYGMGGRLQVERSLRVDLVAERRERTASQAGHELKLRSTLYW